MQGVQGINLTKGFITLNSERLISSSEEDISFFSSIKRYISNGVTSWYRSSSNLNNNFIDGENGRSYQYIKRFETISVDNSMVVMRNSIFGSKDSLNQLINPEFKLKNSTTNTELSEVED